MKRSALSQVSKDIQTPPPPPPSPIFIKNAHIAESNEKSYFRFFRFIFFELWLITFTIYGDTPVTVFTKIPCYASSYATYAVELLYAAICQMNI